MKKNIRFKILLAGMLLVPSMSFADLNVNGVDADRKCSYVNFNFYNTETDIRKLYVRGRCKDVYIGTNLNAVISNSHVSYSFLANNIGVNNMLMFTVELPIPIFDQLTADPKLTISW